MSGGILLQLAVDTLAAAALYSLVALAVWLAYSGSGTIHMAVGQIALTGALVSAILFGRGISLWVAVPAGLAAGGVLSAIAERGLVAPSLGRPLLGAVLLVAMAVVLSEVVRGLFPHPAYSFPSPGGTVSVGGGLIHLADVVTIAAVAAVGAATAWLLRRTLMGAALRVTAGAPAAAEAIGVETALVRTLAFAIGGALATAALLLGVNRFPPGSGVAGAGGVTVVLALRGIAAAVGGGLRSPLRVVGAAIVIAAAEVVGGYWLGSGGEFISDAAAAGLIAAGWRRERSR
jgi:branched-chain amino acid transport system permease protein